jgi:zinc transport system substrate-binding protein
MPTPHRSFASFLFSLALLVACGDREAQQSPAGTAPTTVAATPLRVAVVNYPLQYFAERIGGDSIEVVFPAPPEIDPATWSPSADEVALYQESDLVLLSGAGYAKWVGKVSLSKRSLVDTSSAYADRLLPLEEAVTHSPGPSGSHEHSGFAFTTWLDPDLARAQAEAVTEAFATARPEEERSFRDRFAKLQDDLEALDERCTALAPSLSAQPLLFSHPVYQYFVDRYGLSARSLHWEPDATPDEEAWRELDELLEEHAAEIMIWEGEPTAATRAGLEERGLAIVVFDPSGNAPEEGDLLSILNRGVDGLEAVLGHPALQEE